MSKRKDLPDLEIVQEKKKSKPKDERLQGKNFFLTFPKSETATKEDVVKGIKQVFGDNLDRWVVSKEKHEDGTDHYHCYIGLHNKVKVSHKKLDEITGKRGNYQTSRNVENVVGYIIKDGGNLNVQ